MSSYTPTVTGTGPRAAVQRFGAFLAGMVMPNLGAFIAFGLITALFIPTGWINTIAGTTAHPLPITNQIGSVVGPLINILIPILIAYTGGRMVHGTRGAVVGAVALIGAMMAPVALSLTAISLNGEKNVPPANISEIGPTILAAFVLGPLTAWVLRLWDNFIAGKVKGGFEMLVDNFSAGIVGGVFAVIGLYVVGPITFWISQGLGWLANALINLHLLPLVSIIVEPAKVLFLNNAINHGVFTPLGIEQASTAGKSIFFMIESNPGPGLGILTAMLLFGPRAIRPTVPAAMVVHFLGGIHEIYFPYVLMKPILVVAAIVGGASGVLWESIFGLGLVGPASPGSIIAWALVSPPSNIALNLIGIFIAAAVTFIIGALLLGFGRKESAVDAALDLEAAQEKSAQNKTASKAAPRHPDESTFKGDEDMATIDGSNIKKLIVACDAGMGSSVMLASTLKKQLAKSGVTVDHSSVAEIPKDADVVLTQTGLADRARGVVPDVPVVPFNLFLGDPAVTRVVKAILDGSTIEV